MGETPVTVESRIITCGNLVLRNPNSCEKSTHNFFGVRRAVLDSSEIRVESAILVPNGDLVGQV